MTGRLAGLIFLFAVIVAGFLFVMIVQPEVPPDQIAFETRTYSSLEGWKEDDPSGALTAFQKSCDRLLVLPDTANLGDGAISGTIQDWAGNMGDWRDACEAALEISASDADTARRYFQTWFKPVAIMNHRDQLGLFTGYYEPVLRGSLTKSDQFNVPVYPRPAGHISVELGNFKESLDGQRVVGRVEGNRLIPTESRAEIDRGALAGGPTPLLWLDSAVDAFFMHIQGSARIDLDNGETVRVGYAGTNGHVYVAIGRVLVERGAIPEDEVSAQSIKAWLAAHPDEADEVMQENASYIFFQIRDVGPVGAQGVVLTAGRSLAVDKRWIPLGVPVWIDTTAMPDRADTPQRIKRLMVAQDVGGAIKGVVRGDIYWGSGDEAGEIAGRMKEFGRYHVFLPRALLIRQSEKKK
jgi:membrane-bound lytic murein transglycosylase A